MATVLIVDDDPVNRELLHAYLEGLGHQLVDASSGEQALELVDRAAPDLVLLDVMLPGLDGFATTQRIKERCRDELLPVILVTALDDQAARLRGLRSGADEFLTKPVDRHELELRMTHLLALRDKEAALARRNVELAELQRFRDEMSQLIVHDLKNPLTVMLTNLEFVLSDDSIASPDAVEALRDSKAAGDRALRLLANLLDVAKLEAGRLQPQRSRAPLRALVDPLVQERLPLARSRGITITSRLHKEAVHADVELIGRVVENIFDNALRYTPAGGLIAVEANEAEGAVQLRIGNSGAPVPPESRGRVFEKFSQAQEGVGRMNLGLGLYFCRLAIEAHGGRIWLEETPRLPTVFSLELPA